MTSHEQFIIDSLTKTLNMTDEEFKSTIPKDECFGDWDDPDLREDNLDPDDWGWDEVDEEAEALFMKHADDKCLTCLLIDAGKL